MTGPPSWGTPVELCAAGRVPAGRWGGPVLGSQPDPALPRRHQASTVGLSDPQHLHLQWHH